MRDLLTLAPGRVALTLIDLQEEHRHDPRYVVAGFDLILAKAARLLDGARAAGIPVLHAKFARNFERAPPRPFEPRAADGAPLFSDPSNSLAAICEEVKPRPGEFVAEKDDASAFTAPSYVSQIQAVRPDWLVICGVWTEACVAATVRDAQAAGIRVLLVKDACGSGTALMHEVGILNLANRLYGGAVADTERTLRLFSGETVGVWQIRGSVPIQFTAESVAQEYRDL